jgi:sulfotransferase
MEKFHVVTGLPRSGSTLVCNILNQNPRFYASSTSPLATGLATMGVAWSASPEMKSMLHYDRDDTEQRMNASLVSLVESWYKGKDGVVFDKARGWSHQALLLEKLYPEAKLLVCVRDLRAIFGSVEKQNRKQPAFDEATDAVGKTLYARADSMFGPQGIIGMPLNGVEDLLRRRPKNTVIVQYEAFVKNPDMTMQRIYDHIGEPWFQHDFNNVENVAEDIDALYLNKYDHNGCGKVEEPDPKEWEQYVSSDVAKLIMERFPMYNTSFGYQ